MLKELEYLLLKKIKTVLHSKYFFFILFIIALCSVLLITKLFKFHSKYDRKTNNFKVMVLDYKIDGNLLSATVKEKEKLKLTYYFASEEEKNYYLKNIKYGSYLMVEGSLNKARKNTIPNIFNYQKYLYEHQIYYVLNASKIKIKTNNNIFYKIKNYVNEKINKSRNKDYLQTFLLGNKTYLDSNTLDNFKSNGVSHLFAISGMHLSFFAVFLGYLLTVFKLNSKVKNFIISLVLLFYSFLANFTPSITRALIFFILLAINKEFKLKISSINLLFLTFVIMVIINPFYIYDIGFIYSFVTTFTIVYISKKLGGKRKLYQTFMISLICFLGSVPITLSNFYEINFLSIIINILLTPLISMVIYPLSLISLVLPIDFILNIFLNILDFLNNFLASITIFKVILPIHSFIIIGIYYLIFYLFTSSLNYKYGGMLFIVLFIAYLIPKLDSKAYAYFLDVGQGDSALIISSYKKDVTLIDTGGKVEFNKEEWKEQKEKYYLTDNTITLLKSLGIRRLDNLIITHGDFDHMGEAGHLVENFKVKRVIFNRDEINDLEQELIDILDEKKIKYYKGANKLKIYKHCLEFLNTKLLDDENDNSNVVYLNYEGIKFLFMGDAGVKREKEIVNNYKLENINFLKVGHHGSDTSSSKEFINKIIPQIGVISVGKNNLYGHPNVETLNNLANSKIYRTDVDGTIEVILKKYKYFIKTYA